MLRSAHAIEGSARVTARRIGRDGVAAAVLLLLGLAVRAVYLFEHSSSPTFAAPIVDSHTYDRLASAFAAGSGLTDEFFWQPFFYPFALALLYAAGGSVLAAKVLQALVGAATCALTFRLGLVAFDRRTGIVAGAVVALYGPLVFEDGELLATGWASFWSVALLLLLSSAGRSPRAARLAILGAAGALAVLTRPTFLPFLAVSCAWLARRWHRDGVAPRRAALLLASGLAAFAVVVTPVALASRAYSGRLSFLPASAGVNLYIGNNPDSSRTVAIRPGWDWEELTRLPAQHGVEQKKDTSRFFQDRVAEYARSDPAGFVKGLADKAVQFVSSRELPRNTDVYVHREWSLVLSALVWKAGGFGFPFGVLLPLAAFGVVARFRQTPAPLLWFASLYPASVVLVFVASRYRAPVVPVLAVLGAAGALALADAWRAGRWSRVALAAGVALPLVLLSTLPGPFVQEAADYRAEIDYLVGSQALDEGDLDRARALLGSAVERVPLHSDANNALGLAYAKMNRPDLALVHFERAVRGNPRSVTARDNYARALAGQGDLEGALAQFRTALEQEPWNADVRSRCGRTLAALRRYDEALEQFEVALRVRPHDADFLFESARALRGRGDPERAAARLEAALAADGLHRPALDLLAATLAELGRGREVLPLYRAALVRAQAAGDAKLAEYAQGRLRVLEGGPRQLD
jgi:Tfp pilus assembly protein PilF